MRSSTLLMQLSAALCGVAGLAFAQSACENLKSLSIPAWSSRPSRPSPPDPISLRRVQDWERAGQRGNPDARLNRRCSRRIAAWPRHCSPPRTPTSRWNCGCRSENWNGKFQDGGQRRLGRHHQLPADGRGAARRLRHRVHRHRSRRRQRHVRARASGEDRRFRLARGARNGGQVEGADQGLLRPKLEVLLLERLLHGRPAGAGGSDQIPGRFRRRAGRSARQSAHPSACGGRGTIHRDDEESRTARCRRPTWRCCTKRCSRSATRWTA